MTHSTGAAGGANKQSHGENLRKALGAAPDDGLTDEQRAAGVVRTSRPTWTPPKVWPPESRIGPPRGDSFGDDVGWPADLESATTPELIEGLGGRNNHRAYALDYKLRIIASLRECVGDGVSVEQGLERLDMILHFSGEPQSGMYYGTHSTVHSTQLTVAEDRVVLACLAKAHQGAVLLRSTDYRNREFHLGMGITFPLGMDHVYRAVRENDYDVW